MFTIASSTTGKQENIMTTYTLNFKNKNSGFVVEAHDMAHAIELLNEHRADGWDLSGITTVSGEFYQIA